LSLAAAHRSFRSMSARVPLDVDMEDRLLYGLTPTHLAYMVVALLVGFALWSSNWAPTPARAAASFLVIGVGALVAWGRWRGRAADVWVADAVFFGVRCHRIVWNESSIRRWRVFGAKRSPHPEAEAPTTDTGPVPAAV
jgi:hypothetical protein